MRQREELRMHRQEEQRMHRREEDMMPGSGKPCWDRLEEEQTAVEGDRQRSLDPDLA